MEVSVRPPKHHYDVISYHCVSKLAHFVEHDIGYQPSKFQCSRMSGSNFMEGVETPQCHNEIKKPLKGLTVGLFKTFGFLSSLVGFFRGPGRTHLATP